ncbi:MAG TPA: helix-turn-helix transcriptional regulator [Flavobacterium sp.]|jgi:transcriptional regulator with XRE-family HTH domain
MNTVIGNKLKQYRKEKGWTQEQVADFLNISQSTYARIESGQSNSWANHIEKFCKVFQVTSEELLKTDTIDYKQDNIVPLDLVSQKLIEQYEERIKELKETITFLKTNK